ncbi:hypothetical protein [Asticcacaulis sp. EMRT-3]|uniref:hypothetical protein n=1 Tax=Asticcacaulis sp. EMRT-3 TaxID=3040349 RepID=UPI0024AE989A|nr:hypothetical protein [Asticcacaulis sp. EMRT-3]MDI7774685.1 hypothetical protein [Asticcacaulis sp. EMRT-3]
MSGLFARLFEEFGRAIEDIRHKAVEEGWFGREVTGQAPGADSAESPSESLGWDMPRASFDAQWAPAEKKQDIEPAKEAPEPDIDR